MDTCEIEELHEKETVAPPMVIAVAVKKGDNSMFAVEWALEKFMSQGETLTLLHVRPRLLLIPTPMGNRVPISHVQEDAVAAYIQEVELQTNAMFSPYQRLCDAKKVKTVLSITEEDDVASAIIQQISSYGIGKLVIGSSSSNAITRRFKSPDVPTTVAKNAPYFCTVYPISKCKLSSVHSTSSTEFKIGNSEDFSNRPSDFSDRSDSRFHRTGGTESESEVSIQFYPQPLPLQRNQSLSNTNQIMRSLSISNPVSTISNVESRSGSISMRSQTSSICAVYNSGIGRSSMSRSEGYSEYSSTMSIEERESPDNTGLPKTPALSIGYLPFMEIDTFSTSRNQFNLDTPSADGLSGTLQADPAIFSENVNIHNENRKPEMEISSLDFKTALTSNNEPWSQSQNIMIEVERLKLELKHTLGLFAVAREEAMNAKITANELTVQRIQEVRKVEEAKIREYIARTIAAQEKAKSQTAMRQAETARQLAEKEAQQRRYAELRVTIESEEKKKAQKALASTHQGYRKYSIGEIQSATDFFSDSLKIGEGPYGAVYMGTFQHTKVAVKLLRNEANQGMQHFQQEIEILSRIRHPHMVLLLGACPEHGCLVYEYMANGSLENRLFCKNNSAPLSWFSRFRIIWEVASALLFLHSAKPEPIVHRALKPANILLDYNFVSKISDADLARLVPAKTTTMVIQYNDTVPAGTFCYIDPEYQRTGDLGPKSDLYALGIIILQLLTAKPPMAVTDAVETAIKDGSFQQILDKNAGDWPHQEALELAILGLKCAEFQRRDRPDLEKDVLPELERFKALADAQRRHIREDIDAMPPSHFFCPILQEIMDDPHVAADGFTYEYGTIKTWLDNNNTSPMTNLSLKHKYLIPNHALRSAILEWKIKSGFNNYNRSNI
jgi:serine/threonine protein kinase/nucleotide-binding universal stress UspA family protein